MRLCSTNARRRVARNTGLGPRHNFRRRQIDVARVFLPEVRKKIEAPFYVHTLGAKNIHAYITQQYNPKRSRGREEGGTGADAGADDHQPPDTPAGGEYGG